MWRSPSKSSTRGKIAMRSDQLERMSEMLKGQLQQTVDDMIAAAKRERKDQDTGDPELGLIVRKYRLNDGHSLRRLARLTGLNFGFIGRIESGARGISVDTLARLGMALGQDFVDEYMKAVTDHVRRERAELDDQRRSEAATGQPPPERGALATA